MGEGVWMFFMGGWRYVLNEWGWLGIFYGCVVVGGSEWRYILSSLGWVRVSHIF